MRPKNLGMTCLMAGAVTLMLLCPEMAYSAGQFEAKMGRLRDGLTGTLLPLVSTIGLVYAAILAISGSGESKGKVITVIVMSIIGFLARYIIEFFQGIAG